MSSPSATVIGDVDPTFHTTTSSQLGYPVQYATNVSLVPSRVTIGVRWFGVTALPSVVPPGTPVAVPTEGNTPCTRYPIAPSTLEYQATVPAESVNARLGRYAQHALPGT